MVKDYGTVEAAAEANDAVASVTGPHPKPDRMRYAALVQFCLLTFGTAGSVGAHCVIFSEFQAYFGLSIDQVDFLNTVFLGTYILVGGLIMRIFTQFGLKGGMRTGSVLFLLGSVLRVVAVHYAPHSYAIIVAGQFLQACAINFAMAGPSLLSATWFPASERTVATTIAAQADNLGIACSLAFPSLFVTPETTGAESMYKVFGCLLVIAIADSCLTFFVVPDRPLVVEALSEQASELEATAAAAAPPLVTGQLTTNPAAGLCSAAASEQENEEEQEVHNALRCGSATHEQEKEGSSRRTTTTTKKNPDESAPLLFESSCVSLEALQAAEEERTQGNLTVLEMFEQVAHFTPYVLLSLAASLAVAVYWTYSTIYAQILAPFGVTSQDAGTLGAVKILLSILPATLVAHRIDQTRQYKAPLVLVLSACLVCFLAQIYVLAHHQTTTAGLVLPLTYLIHLVMGVAQSLLMPIALEFMVEITYPVDPSVSAGVFMYLLRVLCTVVVGVAPWLLPANATQLQALRVMWMYAVLSAGGVVAALLVNAPLKRLERERQLSHRPDGDSYVLKVLPSAGGSPSSSMGGRKRRRSLVLAREHDSNPSTQDRRAVTTRRTTSELTASSIHSSVQEQP